MEMEAPFDGLLLFTISVADPGEKPGRPPRLFFDQTEARRAEKIFFETGPPLISGSGSK